MGRELRELAEWWTQASQEARFQILRAAIQENTPPLKTLHLAIIAAETEAGEVSEG